MKRMLTDEQIACAVAHAQGPDARVVGSRELTGGTFNSVHLRTLAAGKGAPHTDADADADADAGEWPAVLKVAPPSGTALMTYENALMRTEAEFYRYASAVPGLPVPRVLAIGSDRSAIDGDYLLMTHLEGEPRAQLRPGIGAEDQTRLRTDLGRLVRRLHISRDPAFLSGYRPAPLTAGERLRTAMYRAYLALIVLIEGVPRGYDPEARAPSPPWPPPTLLAALDLLGRGV